MLAALQLLFAATCAAAAEGGSLEWPIKATYLYKLADFVGWPADAPPERGVVLCVVGDDPFGDVLDRAVDGVRIGGRPIELRRLPTITRGSDCRILYAAGSPAQGVAAILAVVQGEPVLTVTDAALGGAGGVIRFVVVDNRVRFDIDLAAAAANRLTISSKLLSLALGTRTRS